MLTGSMCVFGWCGAATGPEPVNTSRYVDKSSRLNQTASVFHWRQLAEARGTSDQPALSASRRKHITGWFRS